MFFQGSLQEGINTAVQEAKLVLCFVTDGQDESQLWEDDFLADESLKTPLESQAVVLRLQAGSEEAGYLEALFPVPRKPTVVVIKNGQLKEYIAAGTSRDEFIRRTRAVIGSAPGQTQQSSTAASPAAQTSPQAQAPAPTAEAPESSTQAAPTSAQDARAAEVQAALAERAKRLEADKKAKEAAAKAEAEARAKARAEVDRTNESQHTNIKASERSYAEEVRQRKKQANEERRRILKRIEDDRHERKEREAQDRQARLLLGEGAAGNPGTTAAPIALNSFPSSSSSPSTRTRGSGRAGDHSHCNLQVRLFDGSTMRARFDRDSTLSGDVRPWIDRERTDGSDAPYKFRVVMTPLPNKAIAAGEEAETLADLGLAPSATLVLVPVRRHASAYPPSAATVFLWPVVGFVLSLFSSGYRTITGVLGGITGMLFGRGGDGGGARGRGDGTEEADIPMDDLATADRQRASRIRGFQNPEDRRRDAQLYNGNSLNFEPRRDDEDEDLSSR